MGLTERFVASRSAGASIIFCVCVSEILVEGRNAGVPDQEAALVYLSIPSSPRIGRRCLRLGGAALDLPRGRGGTVRFFFGEASSQNAIL
jgi:hypothetical protein